MNWKSLEKKLNFVEIKVRFCGRPNSIKEELKLKNNKKKDK